MASVVDSPVPVAVDETPVTTAPPGAHGKIGVYACTVTDDGGKLTHPRTASNDAEIQEGRACRPPQTEAASSGDAETLTNAQCADPLEFAAEPSIYPDDDIETLYTALPPDDQATLWQRAREVLASRGVARWAQIRPVILETIAAILSPGPTVQAAG